MSQPINPLHLLASSAPDNQSAFTTTYQVADNTDPVKFSLSFGPPGVAVSSTVKLGSTLLLQSQAGSITDEPVGLGNSIAGQFLTIYSIVTVTGETPVPTNLALGFSIDGGLQSYTHALTQSVNAAGTSVFFKIEVFFFS